MRSWVAHLRPASAGRFPDYSLQPRDPGRLAGWLWLGPFGFIAVWSYYSQLSTTANFLGHLNIFYQYSETGKRGKLKCLGLGFRPSHFLRKKQKEDEPSRTRYWSMRPGLSTWKPKEVCNYVFCILKSWLTPQASSTDSCIIQSPPS